MTELIKNVNVSLRYMYLFEIKLNFNLKYGNKMYVIIKFNKNGNLNSTLTSFLKATEVIFSRSNIVRRRTTTLNPLTL